MNESQHSPIRTLVVVDDNRLGGCPRRIFHPQGEPLMQVSDEILKCVAFLSCLTAAGQEDRGTAFFVSQTFPGGQPGEGVLFAVTAKHVIDKAKSKGTDGKVYFRLNRKDGNAEYVAIPVTDWVKHPKTSADVAIATIDLDFLVYDHLSIPQKMFVSDPQETAHGIGPGSDLFFPGLFVRHKGTKSNIPIIRTGTIAAMPIEPIETDQGTVRAYLAEARSIGGLSGSPVFTHLGLNYTTPIHFLGLVKSHYDIEDCLDVSKQINMGIALVVPDDDILELLNSDVFDPARKAAQDESAERRRKLLPKDD
ncbi:hypothetical protein [Lacipirellula parvula]|uniref:Serine protease n=1 Tax=Lacipirellula parvula TaxID=2650471 RepID=A0A5K7XKI7_9BACT|nr:hypothetical protein [Lacipirellula parvula]BBO34803.1 hypothetical protein PLANPX_4415 [Lacipirellula parvula]